MKNGICKKLSVAGSAGAIFYRHILCSCYAYKKTAETFSSYDLGEYPPDIPRDIRRAEL